MMSDFKKITTNYLHNCTNDQLLALVISYKQTPWLKRDSHQRFAIKVARKELAKRYAR